MSMPSNSTKSTKLASSSELLNNLKIIWKVIYNKPTEYISKDPKFEILINI